MWLSMNKPYIILITIKSVVVWQAAVSTNFMNVNNICMPDDVLYAGRVTFGYNETGNELKGVTF